MAEEEKKTSKKDITFICQIIAAIWIAGWTAFGFVKTIFSNGHVAVGDIILSGLAIAACFSPVYFSILFDKIKDWKVASITSESEIKKEENLR